ncbi:MAG: hypothetical protein IH621_07075 [Krumholzibacteria bacterium]|nr:hypothetical protein [Candidatus Krumholzibacteria bacterium]
MPTNRFRRPLMTLAAVLAWAAASVAPAQEDPVQLLFIHHSVGGALLADAGPVSGGGRDSGERCIYVSHPEGGGLRSDLEAAGFAVNEASYGSTVGEDTDICHWRRKFSEQMDLVLRTRRQDELLPDGVTNQVVVFKSCYPNNGFVAEGGEPGDPDACERTVANAMAAYRALLPEFAAHPEVLFVAVTAPAQAEPRPVGLKAKVKALFAGKPREADLARSFNGWLADAQRGWLADYQGGNVVVFDYYDVLTGHGRSNWSVYPTYDGRDSHPSIEGNRAAAAAFVPFLQQALARHRNAAGGST